MTGIPNHIHATEVVVQTKVQTMKTRRVLTAITMAVFFFFSATALPAVAASVIEHTFVVSQMKMTHLCKETPVTVVNGQLPGPVIDVTEGNPHARAAPCHTLNFLDFRM
ncbi:hypothetical protein PVAP13_8KG363610 [Panicum virgatum]|uniref:Uncharacterized protein n=1 Tax=Panicum virgatum TaxID=38727 RepID=A0A8T0PRU0_PANVG|nr:hypothetical protein PVAP13_8KG363610 [Panicum virgatum]